MKRTPLRRSAKKRTNDYDLEFAKVKPTIMARSRGECESPRVISEFPTSPQTSAAIMTWHVRADCQGIAQHVHHVQFRSRGGSNDPSNLIALCLNCHSFAHHYLDYSHALGLSRHSWDGVNSSEHEGES